MNSQLPPAYPQPGDVVDSWMIDRILGEGGMGCVARAFHVVLQTPVAVKFMNPQFMTFPGAVERFINEGKASSIIKSDHVVPVTHAGKTSTGTPYLVMECLDGLDLADLVARDGAPGLPNERAVHIVLQVLRGLQAAHGVGIIHRDMKPSNCFVVNHDGEEDFVKILDFGISKVAQPGSVSLTQTGSALGTPLYMSPEQARSPRDVDTRSDLYSVGVILYELLTGHTPFFSEEGEFTEILFKLFTADPPPVQSTRPDLPDELAAAVHKALARDIKERFASALAMAEALEPFAGPQSSQLLGRMRAFKPPAKGSIAPPEALPSSMVAFSALEGRPATDLMASRPRTDVMRGPPVTALLQRAPGKSLDATEAVVAGHVSAAPAALGSRARPEEAGARTQMLPEAARRGAVVKTQPEAQTDLGASRDATGATTHAGEQRRHPGVWVLFAGAVALLIGTVVLVMGIRKQGHDPVVTNASAPPPATSSPPPPQLSASSVPATVTPSASASSVAAPPSSSASSANSVPSARPRPPGANTRPPGDPLDTNVHH